MTAIAQKRSHPVLAAALSALAVGTLGAITTELGEWYDRLRKPALQPPDWVFGPAWTLIFALAALAGVMYWRQREDRDDRQQARRKSRAHENLRRPEHPSFETLPPQDHRTDAQEDQSGGREQPQELIGPAEELPLVRGDPGPDDPVDQLLRGPNRLTNSIVVEANWRDNPFFPEELADEMAADRERQADDYDHVWEGGYLTISDAIIFRKRVKIENFETPPDARFYFGADWGFANDPTALVRSFIKDEKLFIDYEKFGHRVEIDNTPALFDEVPGARAWPIKADGARPETISYMRRQGFNISAADKWPGSVEDGIAHLQGFKEIVIHERCANLQTEARRYSYKVDKQTGDILPIVE